MKWSCPSIFSLLALSLVSCAPLTKIPVNYQSPPLSAVFINANTGKPVEGVAVEYSWPALRRTGNEHNPDMMDIHHVTTTTDSNGVVKIPAWSRWVAMEWEAAHVPIVSYSKAGYKKGYADGLSNGARFLLTENSTVIHHSFFEQSDDVIRRKIEGVWIKTVKLTNGYVIFTNTIGPSNRFSFLGTVFDTNDIQKETWQAEGTWNVASNIFVKNTKKTSSLENNYGLSSQVLAEEHVVRVSDNELILWKTSDRSNSRLKRVK